MHGATPVSKPERSFKTIGLRQIITVQMNPETGLSRSGAYNNNDV